MEALEMATRRPTLSNRAAYRLAGGVIGLGLFASITPTPLYGTTARSGTSPRSP